MKSIISSLVSVHQTDFLFVLDREVLASDTFVLSTDKVTDLFILGLLNSRLVVLRSLAKEPFLNKIDAYTRGCRLAV